MLNFKIENAYGMFVFFVTISVIVFFVQFDKEDEI